MTVWLLRHGMTADNALGRYQGRRDTPLSPEGVRALRPADFSPATVYVSPLRRAVQTAQTLFPAAALVTVGDLAEMDFGDFDGKTADEMAEDPAYRAWVEQGWTPPTAPGWSRAAAPAARTGRRAQSSAAGAAALSPPLWSRLPRKGGKASSSSRTVGPCAP